MTYREERTTEVIEDHPVETHADHPVATHAHTTVTHRGSALGAVERAIVYIFGLIQLLLLLRIVLLAVAAREGNDIVAFIYNVTDVLVAPFRGILGLNEIGAGQASLDVAAIVALIGWTIIELVIIGLVRIARPSA